MKARALFIALIACLAAATIGNAEKSKFYYMDSLCKDHFLQRQYRKLDGGVLWSRNERNLDCTVTFQTHSILQRFMLHFDLLQLDCNDHLYVYDGAHATAPPKADLSCRNTKQQVGALFTRSNFVTLKYVTDNWGTDANGFKLVITAVKDPKHGCKEFRCKQREFCVSADLTCDGVDHCADGSDEDTAALCPAAAARAAARGRRRRRAGPRWPRSAPPRRCAATAARGRPLAGRTCTCNRWRAATGRAAAARAAPRPPRGCRETGRTLRARAGTKRRGRAACGRGRSAERGRPAQGRVVRLRRPGRARRAGAPYRPPTPTLLLRCSVPRRLRCGRETRARAADDEAADLTYPSRVHIYCKNNRCDGRGLVRENTVFTRGRTV